MTQDEIQKMLEQVRTLRLALSKMSADSEYSADRWALRGYLGMAEESLEHAEGYLQEAIEWRS